MNQKNIAESVRFAPLTLAIVLLPLLAFLAFHVHAEEVTDESVKVKNERAVQAQETRDLFQEQNIESGDASLESEEEVTEVSESETGEEEPQMTRAQVRDEMKVMSEEQKMERVHMRITQREEIRSMFTEQETKLREQLQTRKEERLQKADGYKARLQVQTQARLGQYVERIVVRMNTAIDRLEQIANRVSSRINTMEESGADLSLAKAELEKVYPLLEEARDAVSLFSEVSVETLSSETPNSQVHEVRDAAKLAKDSIVTIHSALSDTVQLIKAVNLDDAEEESVEEEEETESSTESETEVE